jgi:hypothetical protein
MAMIVIICATAEGAKMIAEGIIKGEYRQLYRDVAHARQHALEAYPSPQLRRYKIWKVPVSPDGTLLEPTCEPILTS